MKSKRTIYLDTMDIEEAQKLYFQYFQQKENAIYEVIPVTEAYRRMTSEPVVAVLSNPHYNASAMDGIALKASVTHGAHERNPVTLKEGIDFKYVDTGDPISEPYNAVVMIEDVYPNEDGTVSIMKASYPWEHVRVVGEDIAVGDMILPMNHRITPQDMGAMISAGVTQISVWKRLKVGILPTGTEIVSPGEPLKTGSIIDSNSYVFAGMVQDAGGIPTRYNPVPDHREQLKSALLKAVEENDMVVINAGSSAGSEDYTVDLIRELGKVYAHGIAIKPGKPTILGGINGKAVVGIPGYPVSAFLAFKAFVVPLIQGKGNTEASTTTTAVLTKRIVSALKHKEYVRMKLGKVGDQIIGTPLSRGAGATMSLVKADAILNIPKHVEGYEAGNKVTLELLRPLSEIENALVSIGSHDILMDYVHNLMKESGCGYHLSSAHVGSLGGIMAVRKRETHIAPVHLMDEETGVYNLAFIDKYLSDRELFLLKGIRRWQGIYVPKGNPQSIKNLKDIVEKGLNFANRQRGSGTRTLLDYELRKQKIEVDEVCGYEREFMTHTNVALAVYTGNADAGLGIESVARLMGLDFIPLALEDYDFIIPGEYANSPSVQAFLEVLKSEAFAHTLKVLGGYELESFELKKVGSYEGSI